MDATHLPGKELAGLPMCRAVRGASRAEAEHELAPFRAVFFPLPACRLRGVAGYNLRVHPEVFKKPLPTQVHTRRGSAARTALKYTPLAAGGDEQTFGAK